MVLERFVKQLDGCRLCGGAIGGGSNCTCAAEAMKLYRETKGRVTTTSCHIRDLTNDCSGGTNLRQMAAVAREEYGVSNDVLFLAGDFDTVVSNVRSGKRGAILQIRYAPLVGTRHDCFRGKFRDNHAVYLSRAGSTSGTLRVGDPGADGRYAGCPNGWQNIGIGLLRTAAGQLDLGNGVSVAEEYGLGKCYAYLTPPDMPTVALEVIIRPLAGHTYREFNWFQVSNGKIVASHIGRTRGLRENCSQPVYTKTASGSSVRLVKLYNAWRDDVWVRTAWAHPR